MAAPDRERDVLELEEAWRAAAAAGFDNDVEVGGSRARCPVCGHESDVTDIPLGETRPAMDTASNRDGLLVAAYPCPNCDSGLRVTLTEDQIAGAGDRPADVRAGPAPLTPVEAHPERFDEGGPGTLADQGPLTDDEGEDIRHYTGEPVETEQGWVIPGQQNLAGKDNIAGGGEWPDPYTPPTQPLAEAEDPASE
jgi:hypothetical protein